MAYTCGAFSPLNDPCMLDSGHSGPHVAQDKAEWLGGVWLKEPAPKPEPEAHYDKFVDRARKQWHATPGLGGLYDEGSAKSPEQLAAMQRLNAEELERRRWREEARAQLETGETPTSLSMQQMWDEHVESMERNRAEEQRRQLRKGLIAVAVALVLFVVVLVLI